MLNKDSDKAMRRVRVPAIRTEYASVPIRWMMNMRPQMTGRPWSIHHLT